LFSGLKGGTPEETKETLDVGVGALAGSTIMLITVPVCISIFLGSRKLDDEGKAMSAYEPIVPGSNKLVLKPVLPDSCSVTKNGITALPSTPKGARWILYTGVTYLFIQIPSFFFHHDTDEGVKHERPWAIAGFVFAGILFFAYLYAMSKDEDHIDLVEERRNHVHKFLDWSRSNQKTLGAFDPVTLFNILDKDGDGLLDAEDLRLGFKTIGLDLNHNEAQAFFNMMDADGNIAVDMDEFVKFVKEFILNDEAVHAFSNLGSSSARNAQAKEANPGGGVSIPGIVAEGMQEGAQATRRRTLSFSAHPSSSAVATPSRRMRIASSLHTPTSASREVLIRDYGSTETPTTAKFTTQVSRAPAGSDLNAPLLTEYSPRQVSDAQDDSNPMSRPSNRRSSSINDKPAAPIVGSPSMGILLPTKQPRMTNAPTLTGVIAASPSQNLESQREKVMTIGSQKLSALLSGPLRRSLNEHDRSVVQRSVATPSNAVSQARTPAPRGVAMAPEDDRVPYTAPSATDLEVPTGGLSLALARGAMSQERVPGLPESEENLMLPPSSVESSGRSQGRSGLAMALHPSQSVSSTSSDGLGMLPGDVVLNSLARQTSVDRTVNQGFGSSPLSPPRRQDSRRAAVPAAISRAPPPNLVTSPSDGIGGTPGIDLHFPTYSPLIKQSQSPSISRNPAGGASGIIGSAKMDVPRFLRREIVEEVREREEGGDAILIYEQPDRTDNEEFDRINPIPIPPVIMEPIMRWLTDNSRNESVLLRVGIKERWSLHAWAARTGRVGHVTLEDEETGERVLKLFKLEALIGPAQPTKAGRSSSVASRRLSVATTLKPRIPGLPRWACASSKLAKYVLEGIPASNTAGTTKDAIAALEESKITDPALDADDADEDEMYDAVGELQSKSNREPLTLRQVFEAADSTKQGALSLEDLTGFVAKFEIAQLSAQTVKLYFHVYDTDLDRKLSCMDFKHFLESFVAPPTTPEELALDEAEEEELVEESGEHSHGDLEALEGWTESQKKWYGIFLLLFGTVIAAIFSDPMIETVGAVGESLGIRPFYVSFVVTPFASNAAELVAALLFAKGKTNVSIGLSLSSLYGAAAMNNTFCVGIFLALLCVRGLPWTYTAEVISILVAEITVAIICMRESLSQLHALMIGSVYPFSILFVYLLENVFGLN